MLHCCFQFVCWVSDQLHSEVLLAGGTHQRKDVTAVSMLLADYLVLMLQHTCN